MPSDAALPSVDLRTVSHATVRIVELPGRQHWTGCGVIHCVGAVLVEVLDVGEPPPRMMLYVSCPADMGPRGLLRVGNVLDVAFYGRKQPWPKPPVKIPEGVPVRDVKRLSAPPQPE